MKILITGGTGFIGTQLCKRLLESGHELTLLTRRASFSMNGADNIGHLSELPAESAFDAIINLAGEPIANKRWSDDQKAKIIKSRLDITNGLVELIAQAPQKPAVFISGSAIGFYGVETDAPDAEITEAATGDDSFSSKLCCDWEAAARKAQDSGVRTCLLRTGIVLGDGGALKKMLPPFKMGVGGRIGSGEQWMPWIHVTDMVGIILHCLENDAVIGPINCTAPNPVKNVEFTKTLGSALGRPTVFPMPAFVMKALMGQMGEELLLAGKRVVPEKLMQASYPFQYEKLKPALQQITQAR